MAELDKLPAEWNKDRQMIPDSQELPTGRGPAESGDRFYEERSCMCRPSPCSLNLGTDARRDCRKL
jgi:hypothetical protein